jgi:hypothetical protein
MGGKTVLIASELTSIYAYITPQFCVKLTLVHKPAFKKTTEPLRSNVDFNFPEPRYRINF